MERQKRRESEAERLKGRRRLWQLQKEREVRQERGDTKGQERDRDRDRHKRERDRDRGRDRERDRERERDRGRERDAEQKRGRTAKRRRDSALPRGPGSASSPNPKRRNLGTSSRAEFRSSPSRKSRRADDSSPPVNALRNPHRRGTGEILTTAQMLPPKSTPGGDGAKSGRPGASPGQKYRGAREASRPGDTTLPTQGRREVERERPAASDAPSTQSRGSSQAFAVVTDPPLLSRCEADRPMSSQVSTGERRRGGNFFAPPPRGAPSSARRVARAGSPRVDLPYLPKRRDLGEKARVGDRATSDRKRREAEFALAASAHSRSNAELRGDGLPSAVGQRPNAARHNVSEKPTPASTSPAGRHEQRGGRPHPEAETSPSQGRRKVGDGSSHPASSSSTPTCRISSDLFCQSAKAAPKAIVRDLDSRSPQTSAAVIPEKANDSAAKPEVLVNPRHPQIDVGSTPASGTLTGASPHPEELKNDFPSRVSSASSDKADWDDSEDEAKAGSKASLDESDNDDDERRRKRTNDSRSNSRASGSSCSSIHPNLPTFSKAAPPARAASPTSAHYARFSLAPAAPRTTMVKIKGKELPKPYKLTRISAVIGLATSRFGKSAPLAQSSIAPNAAVPRASSVSSGRVPIPSAYSTYSRVAPRPTRQPDCLPLPSPV